MLRIAIIISTLWLDQISAQELPVTEGLLLDLDANKEVEVEDENRVISWKNQIKDNAVDAFVKQDKGRDKYRLRGKKLGLGSGRPTLKKNVEAIAGNHTIIFEEQELINHQEDAFDHLTQGSGYTWLSVMFVYKQIPGKPDVNSFFGNLTNGKPYAGFWGNLMDDNRIWIGTRTGRDFGIKRKKGESNLWHATLNPQVISKKPLLTNAYYLIIGRMGAGIETVNLELFINDTKPVDKKMVPINIEANPSKMVIGQERDAVNHPGYESFHGEIARFLVFERPITNEELDELATFLKGNYQIQ